MTWSPAQQGRVLPSTPSRVAGIRAPVCGHAPTPQCTNSARHHHPQASPECPIPCQGSFALSVPTRLFASSPGLILLCVATPASLAVAMLCFCTLPRQPLVLQSSRDPVSLPFSSIGASVWRCGDGTVGLRVSSVCD